MTASAARKESSAMMTSSMPISCARLAASPDSTTATRPMDCQPLLPMTSNTSEHSSLVGSITTTSGRSRDIRRMASSSDDVPKATNPCAFKFCIRCSRCRSSRMTTSTTGSWFNFTLPGISPAQTFSRKARLLQQICELKGSELAGDISAAGTHVVSESRLDTNIMIFPVVRMRRIVTKRVLAAEFGGNLRENPVEFAVLTAKHVF
jgi:hypothetical protein